MTRRATAVALRARELLGIEVAPGESDQQIRRRVIAVVYSPDAATLPVQWINSTFRSLQPDDVAVRHARRKLAGVVVFDMDRTLAARSLAASARHGLALEKRRSPR